MSKAELLAFFKNTPDAATALQAHRYFSPEKKRKLKRAAQEHFGTWGAAIEAAGLKRKQRIRWTKDKIVTEIQTLADAKKQLSVGRAGSRLCSAAQKHFGSWKAAIDAAGLEPIKQGQKTEWTPERVIISIQRLAEDGLPLHRHSSAVRDCMARAAHRYFGSWRSAVKAAGCRPVADRASAKEVLSEIRRVAARKERFALADFSQRISWAARHHFGSWDQAVEAAGCSCRWHRRSKGQIIREILAYHRRGGSVNAAAVLSDSWGLYQAGRRYFGSWTEALRAAGLVVEVMKIEKNPSYQGIWKQKNRSKKRGAASRG